MRKPLVALLVLGLAAAAASAQPPSTPVVLAPPSVVVSGSISTVGEVDWFSFNLPVTPYFDITTNGSALNDTEIGLYTATGNLVANDDDNGIGLKSVLTFGTGSGLLLGDSYNLGGNGIAEGENGPVPAPGTYYLAVGAYNLTFGATNWTVTGGSSVGDYTLTFYIPEPASLALLALATLLRRR